MDAIAFCSRGSGKAFSAGIDTSDPTFFPLQQDDSDAAQNALSFRPKIIEIQRCFTAVENCAVPVVAALVGPCIGAGVDLACCTNIRLCSWSTKFSIREV
jgi:delta(3,5)-delta(2,4)-dienoyl-CoA isomerase